jgi:spore coat protein U-like protein
MRIQLALALSLAAAAPLPSHADTASMSVSATVLSRSNCRFTTAALVLDFGTLDPVSTADITKTATSSFKCSGSAAVATFSLALGDGQHATGAGMRRMRHTLAASEYLPYSASISPQSGSVGKNVLQAFTVTGTVQAMHFQNARAGDYLDTVVITVLP